MQFESWLKADLKKPLKVENLTGVMFSQDLRGNKIGVEVYDDGEAFSLSAYTITAYVVKANNETISVTGSGVGKQNNKAWVILPENAYDAPGPVNIVIKASTGTSPNVERTTLCCARGYVQRSRTDTVIAGDYEILDVDAVVQMIADVEEACADAESAASAANTAAGKLTGIDAEAHNVANPTPDTIGEATASVTTVSGHYHLNFGIPQGAKGDAARVTGYAYAWQNSDSGTVIPTGTWLPERPATPQGQYLWTRTTLTWNNGDPTVLYNATRQAMDGTAPGSVRTVNDIPPDSNYNVELPTDTVPASQSAHLITSGAVYNERLMKLTVQAWGANPFPMTLNRSWATASTVPVRLDIYPAENAKSAFSVSTGAGTITIDGEISDDVVLTLWLLNNAVTVN